MKKDSGIFVASSGDLVGNRLLGILRSRGYTNLLNERDSQLDLLDDKKLNEFFSDLRPEYVFVTAGKSGGILVNRDKPADLMLDNLKIVCNVVHASFLQKVRYLLYLSSSCVYPRSAPQPLRPESLMTGHLESTNAAYATAKLAGMELCKAYRTQYHVFFQSAVAGNIFGPNDDFSEHTSHVISSLIRKIHQAKIDDASTVDVWGTGEPIRDFIYIDDLIDGCLFVMEKYRKNEPINIGTGRQTKIVDLARLISSIIGYRGELKFDREKPDGMPRKVLDITTIFDLGWRPQVGLEAGIQSTYEWYCSKGI